VAFAHAPHGPHPDVPVPGSASKAPTTPNVAKVLPARAGAVAGGGVKRPRDQPERTPGRDSPTFGEQPVLDSAPRAGKRPTAE
jgi:hypothetical protein